MRALARLYAVDYMQQPYHHISNNERDMPFYGNSWSPFMEHEKMRSHITRPYFVPDSIPTDGDAARLDRSFTKIFMGPAGTVTRLHNDTYHTHAWLSQIRGTKQFILYPPSQARGLLVAHRSSRPCPRHSAHSRTVTHLRSSHLPSLYLVRLPLPPHGLPPHDLSPHDLSPHDLPPHDLPLHILAG